MAKEERREDDRSAQEAEESSSTELRRADGILYPVIGGGTSILLIFIAVSLVRGIFPFAFAPVFILFVLGMVFGSAYVMKTLLTEQ